MNVRSERRGATGAHSGALLAFNSGGHSRPQARRHPRKILHLLCQQPGQTGSGVALVELVRHAGRAGYRQRVIVGLPGETPLPCIDPLRPSDIVAVRFDRAPLDFPIAGMSDVMPYTSTRFSSFTPQMLENYLGAFAAALARAIQGFDPDIIQSNHLWLLSALARVHLPKTPLCVYSHGTELRQLANASHLSRFVVPACSGVDLAFALHADNRDRIAAAFKIPMKRIKIIGAGYREDLFRPEPAAIPARQRQEIVIAYAGKISASKGVPWLIEAFRALTPPAQKRLRLVLAGTCGDPSTEPITQCVGTSERIVFLGALPQAELADVLRRADLFVLPSMFEGLPLVVLEALACGCRVVMTDLPGTDSWLPADLCRQGWVERVPLPRLNGPDTPVAEDLPRFVADLHAAMDRQIVQAILCGRVPECACTRGPLRWSQVFDNVRTQWNRLCRP